MAEDEKGKVVKPVSNGDGKAKARSGKPRKIPKVAMISRTASMGGMGMGNAGSVQGSGGNFYSPELSTDFLELPQSLHEQWNYYRFFYRSEAFVGQAIDLHTELPLSKIRIGVPKCKNREVALAAYRFCEKWAKSINLMDRLQVIVHERNLLGEVFIWFEDATPEMPPDVRGRPSRILDEEGNPVEHWIEYDDADERAFKWLKKNYKGWTSIRVLPPEQVRMESFNFTSERIIELIPDSKTKDIIERAKAGDINAQRVVLSMPAEVVKAVTEGSYIPLNTDPDAGSFVYYLANRKSDYEPRGRSLLERCFLPGTPIWVKRDGIIQQVPVEDADPSTDEALTHKGRFKSFATGFRPVAEEVCVVSVEGIEHTIGVTCEHRFLVIDDDGSERWVEAKDLRVGDSLCEGAVLSTAESPERIDLVDWWTGRTLEGGRRNRPNQAGSDIGSRFLTAVETDGSDDGLTVTFEHRQDDANRVEGVAKVGRLVHWLESLTEPTEASYEAVAAVTSQTESDVRNNAHRLRKVSGLITERKYKKGLARGRGAVTLWHPLPKGTIVHGEFSHFTVSSPVRYIDLTPDFCWLLGTWIGDGCLWTSKDAPLVACQLGWTFGRHSEVAKAVRERVIEIATSAFGAENLTTNASPFHKEDDPDRTTEGVGIIDPLLSRWFMGEFGHKAQGKHLPAWFFDLPDTHLLSFLQGVLDTDGCLIMGRSSIELTLDNKRLIDQIHLICNRLGFNTYVKWSHKPARTWMRKWKTKDGFNEKTYSYEPKSFPLLSANCHDDVMRWADGSVKGRFVDLTTVKAAKKSRFVGGRLTRRVLGVERLPYEGPVYSFGVTNDESHVTGGVVTHNCIRALVYRDKLRQAQTSIASRHMTPIRVVYGENMDAADVEALREQVDMSLQDPDYSIIANFQINWEEMGADQRLLDLNTEYDLTDRQLYAGMGVTEGLLSGESAYSGDKINIEVINTRYMLLREQIQSLVESYFFKPMCARMGFVDTDEDGDEYVVVPTLSFTRLALRDNRDTFDALYNLYQKGSLDVETILELLNLDPVTVREKLEKDLFTVNDPTFNEVLRGIYGDVGRALAEKSNAVEKIAENLGLKYTPPKEEGDGRFG